MRIDHKVWLDHFEYHATRRCVMPQAQPNDFTAWERRLVADSMGYFQRREQSRGRLLRRVAQRHEDQHSLAPLAEIVAMLVAEKQHHAALLGEFMDQHGLPRKRRSWADRLLRRAGGHAGFELHLVALIADALIGKVYYRALEAATGCRQLQTLCRMLVADELAHVGFESDVLLAMQAQKTPRAGAAAAALHRTFFVGVSLRAWLTHRRVLRGAGYTPRSFVRACLTQYSFYLAPPRKIRSSSFRPGLSALEENTLLK